MSTPVFFNMVVGSLGKILLLPDIAAPRLSKKRPCFLEAIFHRSTNQDKPARTAGTKQGGESLLDGISYMIRLLCWFYLKKWRNTISGHFS